MDEELDLAIAQSIEEEINRKSKQMADDEAFAKLIEEEENSNVDAPTSTPPEPTPSIPSLNFTPSQDSSGSMLVDEDLDKAIAMSLQELEDQNEATRNNDSKQSDGNSMIPSIEEEIGIICPTCSKIVDGGSYITFCRKKFHRGCFVCGGCSQKFDTNGRF